MHIHQISVFLENRTNQLAEISNLLAKEHVDIRALSVVEGTDYAIARMIVHDSHKASSILLQHGDILSMTPVWAVEVEDAPGGMANLLAVLAESKVDIEYMYSLFTHQEGKAYMVMRISDEPRFLDTLGRRGIKVMTKAELDLK